VNKLPSIICKLGFHKWRNQGEKVLITWQEPGFIPGTTKTMKKIVFCERKCLRCGIRERRKFSKNVDGTLAAAGWERIKENENEKQFKHKPNNS
jgi:hypothetical protein